MTSGCCEVTPADGLAGRLLHPARRVALADLPAQWFHSIVEVRCRGGRALADDPKFAGAVRGAWGAQLKAAASPEAIAGEACRWQPPCALDVFFRSQGPITPALEIPKPYVLALRADGADLVVRLTLFGFATDWTEAAAEALVRGCREVFFRGRGLEVVDRRYWSGDGIAADDVPAALVLAFETPLEIRLRDAAGHAAESPFALATMVATLGNRISGLARWQDAAVDGDFQALKEHAATLQVQVLDHPPEHWRRFSHRQGQWIPMAGRRPVVLIEGRLAELMPLLAIGETCHAGSHASLGLGRYALLVPQELVKPVTLRSL